MRILHTSDWHLGHTLYDLPREREHAAFLDWLREALCTHEVDALIVAGDVFDAANPSAQAQRMWYEFLVQTWQEHPELEVVVIGGNHDSAARLEAPRPMMDVLGRLHMVGGLPRRSDGTLDEDTLLVPLKRRNGEIGAWVAAVPYLRPADLPPATPLIEGIRAVYHEAFALARARRQPGQAMLTTGHAFLAGGLLSTRSERHIQRGNQDALPVDLFPADVAYVALGHLHLAQEVAGRTHIRYPGSPLPLAAGEADYPHQVCLVDLEGEQLRAVTPLPVPRLVPMIRIPAGGEAAPLEEVLLALAALPARAPGDDEDLYPFLEVTVRVERPEPHLGYRVRAALADRQARLISLRPVLVAREEAPHAPGPAPTLDDLRPRDVFATRWYGTYSEPPSDTIWQAFDQLHEWAQHPEDARVERERQFDLEPPDGGASTSSAWEDEDVPLTPSSGIQEHQPSVAE